MPPRTVRPFLTACWRNLAALNFEVDPSLLAPHLPASTELDLWRGKALVSLVGFQFLDTRVLGLRVPFHRSFPEVNLRFYVRGPQGRGVVFIREIVPRRAVAVAARLSHGENYATAPIRFYYRSIGDLQNISYGWRWKGRESTISVTCSGEFAVPAEGSEGAFILEHYWGYTRLRNGTARAYRVEHPPWRAWNGRGDCQIDGDALYGPGFGDALNSPPVSAMLSEGSEVSVYRAGK